MTDQRSPATVQADLDTVAMILSDIDLACPDQTVSAFPLEQAIPVEFVTPGGETILAARSGVTLGSAVRLLAEAVAGNADRRYLESSRIVPSGREDVLRIAVRLTPVDVTLDGLRTGRYGVERLQAFEMAHAGIDAETLPAEQAEAVNLVRQTLGVD